MKTLILTILLCLAAGSAAAQKSSDPAYRIRANGKGVLTVSFRGKAHRLAVGDRIDAARVTATELLFAREKAGFRYLVIDVTGWSREKQNDRQCGAGTESNLLWLKLDPQWKIADLKSVRYESCWSGIDLNDPFEITKNTLRFEFDNLRDRLSVKVAYRADEPEKGFEIVESKLKGE